MCYYMHEVDKRDSVAFSTQVVEMTVRVRVRVRLRLRIGLRVRLGLGLGSGVKVPSRGGNLAGLNDRVFRSNNRPVRVRGVTMVVTLAINGLRGDADNDTGDICWTSLRGVDDTDAGDDCWMGDGFSGLFCLELPTNPCVDGVGVVSGVEPPNGEGTGRCVEPRRLVV